MIASWVCARAAMLVPGWIEEPAVHGSYTAPIPLRPVRAAEPELAPTTLLVALPKTSPLRLLPTPMDVKAVSLAGDSSPNGGALPLGLRPFPLLVPEAARPPTTLDLPPAIWPAMPIERSGRWSASAWAFVRNGGPPQLAAGGTLGGSQIGGRISYRVNDDAARPLSIVARGYAPRNAPEASEVAIGIEWKPLAALPVRVLAERRQALGPEGRSAFSVLAYGGVSDVELIGSAVMSGYVQAGVVGIRSRDMFADGSMSIAVPLEERGRIRIGAGAWGAAQPGVARLDLGPQVTLVTPFEEKNIRLSAEWRFRIAGDAAPASGPALTLSTDF